MELDNDNRLESLRGPLHNSLQEHFLRYYTIQEKEDNVKIDNQKLADRRFGLLANITDKQEES